MSRWSLSRGTGGWHGPGSVGNSGMGGRMTPDRWRQIDDLFDAALRLDPAERGPWLRQACGGDDNLWAEVDRLLSQDQHADRDGFLTPPEGSDRSPDQTGSWPPRDDHRPGGGSARIN